MAAGGEGAAAWRLELGEVVEAPGFALADDELELLDPALSNGRSKNISLDPAGGPPRGLAEDDRRGMRVGRMMARFADWSEALLDELAPGYAGRLERARTSFRPCPVEQRPQSPRKDDRRLHIDAFPSQPTQGRRILRVFANIDPQGRPRDWRLGEPFEAFAGKFHHRIPAPAPGAGWALQALGLTRGRRTAYDHAMLALHDLAKLDDAYQEAAPRREASFRSGEAWVVYTDAALHAAMSGQYALEQTFLLPVAAMADPDRSPLRTLERLMGKALI